MKKVIGLAAITAIVFALGARAVVGVVAVPASTVSGIAVGGGFVDASTRQVVRTAGDAVYVVAADDNTCQVSGGYGVIRAYKGTGAQASDPNVPTGFAEQDALHHPLAAANSNVCIWNAYSNLFSPDVRLDRSGTIHIAYIDPSSAAGNVWYQTFSTATNTWGPRVLVGTQGTKISGGGWPRAGQVALTLDMNDAPHVVYATSGSANSLRDVHRDGGVWSTPVSVATGSNLMHPSMVTSLDGLIHLAWLDNSLATNATVKYASYGGSWSAAETVSAGDANVLANKNGDQTPSIATDSAGRPHVLYLDGTPSGSNNYVRMRYRQAGSWVDNTPPGRTGGASDPSGTWFAHTPQNYISSLNDEFVFLGHDVNVSPGVYQHQAGGVGTAWSAVDTLDPRTGIDGSMSIRFDPLRETNSSVIDVVYYSENDKTVASPVHHSTLYYKAVEIAGGSPPPPPPPPPLDTTLPSVCLKSPVARALSGVVQVTANASDNVGVAGVQFKIDGVNLGAEDTTSPYGVSWDTTTVADGSHTVASVVRDAAGNTAATSSTVEVVNAGCQP